MTTYQSFLKSLGFIVFFLGLVYFIGSTFGEKIATYFIILVGMSVVLPNSDLLIGKLENIIKIKE